MTKSLCISQITLDKALELVAFEQDVDGTWYVKDVHVTVKGDVRGNVEGDVNGEVFGTIAGRYWIWVETPKNRLKRLIEKGADKKQLLEAFNDLD